MAITHFPTDLSKINAQQLRSVLNALEAGNKGINDHVLTMSNMIIGTIPTSNPADYAYMVTRYGFLAADTITANQTALAAFNELNSVKTALNSAQAALIQAFNRFR